MTEVTNTTAGSGQPGELRGQAYIEIQTRQAQRLVYGRQAKDGKPPIIGLVRYGVLVRQAWVSATLDDPWADWCLLQTLDALEAGRTELQEVREQTEEALRQINGVQIHVAQSHAPVRFPLNFANPYGYMGAYLLADFDACARALLTARHVGLMTRDDSERRLNLAGRAVRRAFTSPQWFRHTGVRRDDIAAQNPRVARAREAMGDIPQDIIDGTLRARIAPEIRKRKAGTEGESSALRAGRGVFSSGTTRKQAGSIEDEQSQAPADQEDNGADHVDGESGKLQQHA